MSVRKGESNAKLCMGAAVNEKNKAKPLRKKQTTMVNLLNVTVF